MKFLEYTSLSRVNSFLGRVNLGDYLIEGVLEAYSCKLAGMDKKLSRSLEQDVVDELATSPVLAKSPVGPLSNSASRRTLIYLILTMNHLYPDYDFSMLRAHHFTKEHSLSSVKQKMDYLLVEAAKAWEELREGAPLAEALWAAIDEVIELVDCDIYSYKAEVDGDPFGEKGSIWSFNYFLYNKKLKRILYFSCRYLRKSALDESSSDDLLSEDEDDFTRDMDIED
eukprot:TRINITY_DN17178_c0_g1_i1.p1 TRINITY_DN17178_c0_g1~~TRINITY_DN17178_c0_g1_i1.p1  ORF type:complete len:226 (-),score=60.59 TRINITY_DN17178_c0_g1_i1:695-1372(-)